MDWMNDKLPKHGWRLVIGFLLICVTGIVLEVQFKIVQRAYDHFVLDNRNHYLSCKDLPAKVEVERVMEQHEDIIRQLQRVSPGFVGVEMDTSTCEGKADLLIWYGTHEQRIAIEKIIGADTFFGIPYRLQNR